MFLTTEYLLVSREGVFTFKINVTFKFSVTFTRYFKIEIINIVSGNTIEFP
jgi:hypothetical protein